MIPEIQKVQGDLEYAYFASSAEIDKEAEEIYKTNPSDAIKIITEYSLGQGKNTFNTWKDLYHYLEDSIDACETLANEIRGVGMKYA